MHMLHLSLLPIPQALYACIQVLVVTEFGHCIALHCIAYRAYVVRALSVCVGGGDEGGHPLPGLRRQSQEAHLQNGRYVYDIVVCVCVCVYIYIYIYIYIYLYVCSLLGTYTYCTYVYISNKLHVQVFIARRAACMHA
jgi:hypothetical protein